jgi:hypothetical protein
MRKPYSLAFSNNLLFSAQLVPNEVQSASNWWYFAPEHGQHVAFYTVEALRVVSKVFNLHLSTDGVGTHLLSQKPFRIASFGFSRMKLGSPGSRADSCASRCGKDRCCWTISTQFPAIASERVPDSDWLMWRARRKTRRLITPLESLDGGTSRLRAKYVFCLRPQFFETLKRRYRQFAAVARL